MGVDEGNEDLRTVETLLFLKVHATPLEGLGIGGGDMESGGVLKIDDLGPPHGNAAPSLDVRLVLPDSLGVTEGDELFGFNVIGHITRVINAPGEEAGACAESIASGEEAKGEGGTIDDGLSYLEKAIDHRDHVLVHRDPGSSQLTKGRLQVMIPVEARIRPPPHRLDGLGGARGDWGLRSPLLGLGQIQGGAVMKDPCGEHPFQHGHVQCLVTGLRKGR